MTRERLATGLLAALAVWAAVGYAAVAILVVPNVSDPDEQAIVRMGGMLLVVWALVGGTFQRLWRDRLAGWICRIPLWWPARFVVLCIVMALLEEAVTTGLTNLAPWFGGVTEAARITASKNYLEVVCLHSVVVFVPAFVIWAVILAVFDFSPPEVMLLYGLTGWLAEWLTFGPQNIGMIGMWVWVYGLMVYLPAHTVPAGRGARRVRWWMWPAALLASLFAGIPFVPVVLLVRWLIGY